MNARTTVPAAILSAVLAFSAGPFARAAEICDDFSDGEVFDGDPISWAKGPGSWEWEYSSTSGCLEVVPDSYIILGTIDSFPGDVSTGLRGSFNGTDRIPDEDGPWLGAYVHAGRAGDGWHAYWGGVDVNRRVVIGKFFAEGYLEVAAALLDYDSYSGEDGQPVDLEIELAATERPGPQVQLELRVWRQDEARPAEPTLPWLDQGFVGGAPHTSGSVAWSVDGASDPVCIHSVCITTPPPPETGPFLRGDCNDDGAVDISDAVFSLGSLFLGDGDPNCDDACDSNDDGTVDISDAVATLGALFLGQGPIPPPGMNDCGVDPTDDEMGCETFSRCP